MSKYRSHSGFFAAIGCLVAVGQASAALTYTGQTRTVTARCESTPTQTKSAAGYGVFDDAASVSYQIPNAPVNTVSNGQASQRSELLADRVTMSGRVSGNDAQPANAGSGSGVGTSGLNVAFVLDQTSGYVFGLNVAGTFGKNYGPTPIGPDFGYRATLTGPSGTVFDTTAVTGANNLSYTGLLVAGSYTLDVQLQNGWTGFASGGGSADYAATLSVPEPAVASAATVALALIGRRRRAV